jgi:hypothetical protein
MMKQTLTFLSILFTTTLSHTASLQVYQDSTIYEYMPKSHYLGMTNSVTATCQGEQLALQREASCEESSERLCQAFQALQQADEKLEMLTNNIKLLDKIISLHQPKVLDAQKTIESAREISTEKSKLEAERKRDKLAMDLQKQAFMKQTSAKLPLYYKKVCLTPTKLKLNRGLIYFNTFYEADLSKKGEVEVTQYLAVTNRSGVDIVAEDAMFYYRMANRTVRPMHFNPWIISEYQPPVPRPQSMLAKSRVMMEKEALDTVAGNISPAPVAEYVDEREYKITNLELPSTGEPVHVKVTSWSSPLECGLYLSPYAANSVYEKCSFTPQSQIENNRWKLKKNKEVINSRAIGEYRDKNYNLYTKVDEDIKVIRKPIVQKERDTGFFGNTIRKKDGYTLTLTNKSDKIKMLNVTERIPTSTTEKIKVKLLSVKSDKKIDYKLLKEGKIEMKVELSPQESKKIEVLFEISYDKDLKVRY